MEEVRTKSLLLTGDAASDEQILARERVLVEEEDRFDGPRLEPIPVHDW